MAEDIKERVLRYLNDAYAVEEGAISALTDLSTDAHHPDVRAAASEHLEQTKLHASRINARIVALGGDASHGKSLVNKVIAMGSDLLNIFHDAEDKQTQDVIKAYALENFEVAMYTALKSYADAVGDYETAQLADSLISEEQLAAERMLRIVPAVAVTAVAKTAHTNPV